MVQDLTLCGWYSLRIPFAHYQEETCQTQSGIEHRMVSLKQGPPLFYIFCRPLLSLAGQLRLQLVWQ